MAVKPIEAPRLAAVIGWPVSHSLSPLIHSTWAMREGVNAFYVPVAAGPSYEEFARVADGLRAAGFKGANVTLPHKEHALRFADDASDEASEAGAANMLTFSHAGAYAGNSDVAGFSAALGEAGGGREAALLIGAGGAGRAVALALSKRCGVKKIYVANRTSGRADEVAALVGGERIDWATIRHELPDVDIVVNATSLGMAGQPSLEIAAGAMKADAIVCDLVYWPLETPLLAAARSRGRRTVDGLSVLMHQAVPAYKGWLGRTAVVDSDLRARAEAALKARAAA